MNYVLVDTSHLMYRSSHTFNKFTTKAGYPTGIHFGVMRAIEHLKKVYPDSTLVFVFDGYPSQRQVLCPEYKAGRASSSSHGEIVHEKGIRMEIRDLIHSCGCATIHHSEYESDDIIAMLALKPHLYLPMIPDQHIVIYSGDDDFCQLVSDKVSILKPPAGKLQPERVMLPGGVYQEWGVHPQSLALYRSFVGDSGDNIKGLPRVPRTRLQEAVLTKKTPPDFYDGDGLAYFTPDWKNKLTDFRPVCELNYRLTELPWAYEQSLPIEYHECGVDLSRLSLLFNKLEFSSFLKKLDTISELLEPASYVKAISRLANRPESGSGSPQRLGQST